MSDSDSDHGFAERRARLEAKDRARDYIDFGDDDRPPQRRRRQKSFPVMPVLMGIALISAFVAGSLYLAPMLKRDPAKAPLVAATPNTPRPSNGGIVTASDDFVEVVLNQGLAKEKRVPTKDTPLFRPMKTPAAPSAALAPGQLGFEYGAGHAANAYKDVISIDQLISGAPDGPDVEGPFTTKQFQPKASCALARVQSGVKPISVLIGAPYKAAPVRLFNRNRVVGTLVEAAKESFEKGFFPSNLPIDRGTMGLVDVVVTDTEAPLHLFLQIRQFDALWNITAADGVEIARITLVGPRNSGVAGNIGNASIEAIRASDFHELVGRFWSGLSARSSCMAQPHATPTPDWLVAHGAAEGKRNDVKLLTRISSAAAAYGTWFQEQTGLPVETNFVTAEKAATVLVGPVPSAPLPYQPLSQTVLHLPKSDYILTGVEDALEADTQSIYSDFLDSAAGGTYSWPLAKDIVLHADGTPAQRVEPVRDNLQLGLGFVDGRQDIRDRSQPEAINDERRASFSVEVPLRKLLEPGEKLPPDDLLPLYAYFRAAKYMERYCEDTLPEMATRCGIVKHTARPLRDGKISIRTTFGFVQNYDVGPLEVRNGAAFISAFLPIEDTRKRFSTPAQRRALIARYLKVCDQLRQEYGNCMLGTLGFYLDRPANFSSGPKAHAAGWVEVYALDQPLVKKKFEARAQDLFEQIRN